MQQPPLQEASRSRRLVGFSLFTGAAILNKYHVVPRTRRLYHHAPQPSVLRRDANVASSCHPGQCAMFPLVLRLRAPPTLRMCQFLCRGQPCSRSPPCYKSHSAYPCPPLPPPTASRLFQARGYCKPLASRLCPARHVIISRTRPRTARSSFARKRRHAARVFNVSGSSRAVPAIPSARRPFFQTLFPLAVQNRRGARVRGLGPTLIPFRTSALSSET